MNVEWSNKELKILKENYNQITLRELGLLLPHRTMCAIKQKAKRLGVVNARKNYSEKEIEFIKSHPEMTDKKIAYYLNNRTESSVSTIRNKYFIESVRKKVPWREDELETLWNLHKDGKTAKEISEYLPDRTVFAIQSQIHLLPMIKRVKNPWTNEEIRILKDTYPYHGKKILSEELSNHTYASIQQKAIELKIKKKM